MYRLRDFLQMLRIHTAPATVILLVSSYVAGGGGLFSLLGLILLVYGIALHGSTFGHNVVMDYYWDIRDEGKKHHPLVAGRIKLTEAVNTVMPFLGLCLAVGLILAYGDYWATFWFALFITCGFLYNNWLSKTTVWGWIPITACFTSLSLYAMSLASSINILYALYIMFTIWFQIGWSGYLKEIQVEEQANLLRRLGVRVSGGWLHIPVIAKLFGGAVKSGNIASAILLISSLNLLKAPVSLAIVSFFLTVMAYMMFKLLRSRSWDRMVELKRMSVMEIATIYAGMFMVMPIVEASILAVFGIAWFTAMNRLLWETKLTPRV